MDIYEAPKWDWGSDGFIAGANIGSLVATLVGTFYINWVAASFLLVLAVGNQIFFKERTGDSISYIHNLLGGFLYYHHFIKREFSAGVRWTTRVEITGFGFGTVHNIWKKTERNEVANLSGL